MIDFLKNKKNIIITILVLIFVVFLCSLFPYSGDDWAWGSSIGIERLESFFKDYNGRYVGNLIVLVLTRSVILRIIAMSATLFGIIYLSYRLTNNKNFSLFLLATFLILALPRLILRQAIVWTSGFTNYAIPTVLILIYFYLIKIKDINKKWKIVLNIFLAILAFCTALFVEHITVYIIVITLIIMMCEWIKSRKVSSKYIFYLIGAILGAVLMFSNGAYSMIANDQDTYRDVPTNGIASIIEKVYENFETIYQELIFNNTILNIVLVGLLLVVIHKFLTKSNVSLVKKSLLTSSTAIIVGYVLYMILKVIYPKWEITLKYTTYFEFAISVLFFFAIALIIFICIEKKEIKKKIILYLLSIAILTLPLFIVQPIGSRCFFTAYCIFILIILELYNYCIEKENLILNKAISIGIIVFAIYLSSIYLYIFKIDQERIDYLLKGKENGAKTIAVVTLPYTNYTWISTPTNGTIWEERMKLFYNIPDDVEIKNISIKEWNKINK